MVYFFLYICRNKFNELIMKKNILLAGISLMLCTMSFAQADSIEVNIQGQTNDIAGTTHIINATNGDLQVVFMNVLNVSSNPKTLFVTRKRITTPPADWEDALCWGISCYTYNANNPWSTPASKIVNSGASSLLTVDVDPSDVVNGSCTYRYYFGEYTDTPEDSVDVLVTTTTLAVKEIKANSPVLTTYPNPADNYLTVTLQSNQTEGFIKMTDVLGKVVLEERISGSRKFDVEEFKNGVYVLVLTSNGVSTSKRIVIRH